MNENATTTRRRFDTEFKRAALEMWRTSGKTRKAVAAELGVSEWNLRDWRDALEPVVRTVGPLRPKTPGEWEEQVRALQRENQRLRNQRDILKKSLGILCEPSANALPT